MNVKISVLILTIFIFGKAQGWYYNCFVQSNVLTQDGCSLLDFEFTSRTIVDNVFFPPTDINFFRSNFSSFSPALGRRFSEETENINLFNCMLPSLAVPLTVKRLGVFFANLQTVIVNYRLPNILEYLSIVETRISDIRFVEALPKLKFLRIQKNKVPFVNFARFRNLTDLETIDLSENQIIHIDTGNDLLELPKLVELRLNKNYLVQFEPGTWYFPKLLILKIHYNLIKSVNIEELTASFPNLSDFSIASNPWNCGRLNAMVSFLLANNILYQEASDNLRCQFNLMDTIDFSTQDNVTYAKRTLNHMNESASIYYLDAESKVLEDVRKRNAVLRDAISFEKNRMEELTARISYLRSTIREMRFKNVLRIARPVQ